MVAINSPASAIGTSAAASVGGGRTDYGEQLRLAIETYIERGLTVMPLPPGSKAPPPKGWKERSFAADDFSAADNVALRHDDGLCDVDLDWPESRSLAYRVLLKSACFGRASAWPSHVLYRCRELRRTTKFTLPATVKDDPRFVASAHSMVVMEARVGQSTMVPPSIHPSGESLEWFERDIVDIAAETLQRRCGLLAVLSVALRCYPGEGTRHDVGIALSGALVRAGYDGDEANRLTRLVAELASDGEAEARGDGNGAAEKLVAGQEVAGLPRLCELLGLPEDVAKAFGKWLRHAEAPEGAIVLDNDREPENLDKIDAAFVASDLPHFQRLGRRVHVTRNAKADQERAGALVIREASRRVIQQDAQRLVKFLRYDGRHGAYIAAACPDRLAEMYLCKSNGWRVPELRGVRESPTLRADGSILQAPGYDEKTGLWYEPRSSYPVIPEDPTRVDAEAAFDEIAHVVRDFDFATDADASTWLAAVLTAAIRPALEAAPVFGFDAPQFGAGKTLLATLSA